MAREFSLIGQHGISCNEPCNHQETDVVGGKVKGFPDTSATVRCLARGAAFRGQHYGSQEDHSVKPEACRVCTVYTALPNPSTT